MGNLLFCPLLRTALAGAGSKPARHGVLMLPEMHIAHIFCPPLNPRLRQSPRRRWTRRMPATRWGTGAANGEQYEESGEQHAASSSGDHPGSMHDSRFSVLSSRFSASPGSGMMPPDC